MKNAVILLAVVALVVVTLGAFNREASVDVDYVFGVWTSVNVFWLFLIAAGVLFAAGLLGAALARAQGWRERGKLEKELLEVYRRLRSAEAEVARAAGAAGAAAAVAEARTMAAAGAPEAAVAGPALSAATSVPPSDETATTETAETAAPNDVTSVPDDPGGSSPDGGGGSAGA